MRYLRFFSLLVSVLLPLLAFCSNAKRYDRQSGISAFPSPNANQKCIVLDAGHGGFDEGAKFRAFMEKRATLSTSLLIKKYLEEKGYRVILTRSRDTFLSLGRRVEIANQTQGDIFVSIHYNASTNSIAKGIEVYYCRSSAENRTRDSKRLANCILPCLIDQTDAASRGVKQAKFLVIKDTQMPAVLVEGGFVTNPQERALLKDKTYLEKIAKGIAEGIDKYLKS
jgi:N-acetylmuramoyl-L-alanine amidase